MTLLAKLQMQEVLFGQTFMQQIKDIDTKATYCLRKEETTNIQSALNEKSMEGEETAVTQETLSKTQTGVEDGLCLVTTCVLSFLSVAPTVYRKTNYYSH